MPSQIDKGLRRQQLSVSRAHLGGEDDGGRGLVGDDRGEGVLLGSREDGLGRALWGKLEKLPLSFSSYLSKVRLTGIQP